MYKFPICLFLLFCGLLLSNDLAAQSQTLKKVALDEEQIILLDVVLNNSTISRSIEAYQEGDKLLLAIEPLFDALKIRYIISDSSISIWQDELEHRFALDSGPNVTDPNSFLWASDDFYVFTELALFESLFSAKMEFSYRRLHLKIITPEKVPIFPVQKILQQNKQREIGRLSRSSKVDEEEQLPITIADQYRLLTVPHGRINVAAEKNNRDSGVNSSAQLTADFLYHSASLTLSDSADADLAARLVLSRYKTTPNDYILGIYDQYQVGDVSSVSNGLSTASSGGIGLSFSHLPVNFRHSNQSITIEEISPPGWEAELFRNSIFLGATTVPENGLLIFQNVEVEYGVNNYEIRLFGPFGETEVRKKAVDLTQNALSKGQFTHGLYALDRNHRLINDQSDQDYKITDFGGTLEYGVNDNWQIGFGFAGLENDRQFYNFTNAFSLPGLLLENDISLDQDGNYAQVTSVKGRAFSEDSYSFVFESADNFTSDRTSVTGKSFGGQGSYTQVNDIVNLNFDLSYREDDLFQNVRLGNRLAGRVGQILIRHNLSYFENTSKQADGAKNSGVIGALGVSGTLPYNFRVSADIQYDPEASDVLLKSSSVVLQKSLRDPWQGYHYLTARYQPLADESSASWNVSYRASWQTEAYRLNLSTLYDENHNWSFQMGLQFFLGYDYHNNRLLLNQNIQSNSATLNVHSYLDRHLNGVPDPLDYNLADVEFTGNREWENIRSTKKGRTILPGVYAVTPFTFGARWKEGSKSINNDYLVYTHPGAYVDVNMPFVLSTDLVGFVLRTRSGREIGLQNASVELLDEEQNLLQIKDTDLDGYYEFNALAPGYYQIRVAASSLQERGYTSEVVGFNVLTGGQGGYSELPAIKLRRAVEGEAPGAQEIEIFSLDADNTEAVIWDDDESVRQNYFTLPTKDKVMAKHSLTQAKAVSKPQSELADEQSSSEATSLAAQQPALTSSTVAAAVPFLNRNTASGGLPRLTIGATSINNIATIAAPPVISAAEVQTAAVAPIMQGEFVIQLGAYREIIYAQELIDSMVSGIFRAEHFAIVKDADGEAYRLSYGAFQTRDSGVEFARKYMAPGQSYYVRKKDVTAPIEQNRTAPRLLNSGWVIQLYASATPLDTAPLSAEFGAVGPLYLATKETSSQSVLYCLVSRTFSNKEAANAELARSGLNGWISRSSSYTSINQL